jgi:hypothetical protein
MEIIINSKDIEQQVEKAIRRKMKQVFRESEKILYQNAVALRDTFKNSSTFMDLKNRFRGEFGFTPDEVVNLDRVLELMVPGGNDITITKLTFGKEYSIILDWVDYTKLKAHPYAQHELTKLNENGNVESITDIISWVEWMEEGASIFGYYFTKGNVVSNKYSRSGLGVMKPSPGGLWTFQPTRILEAIASAEDGKFIKKGFGVLLRSMKRRGF